MRLKFYAIAAIGVAAIATGAFFYQNRVPVLYCDFGNETKSMPAEITLHESKGKIFIDFGNNSREWDATFTKGSISFTSDPESEYRHVIDRGNLSFSFQKGVTDDSPLIKKPCSLTKPKQLI